MPLSSVYVFRPMTTVLPRMSLNLSTGGLTQSSTHPVCKGATAIGGSPASFPVTRKWEYVVNRWLPFSAGYTTAVKPSSRIYDSHIHAHGSHAETPAMRSVVVSGEGSDACVGAGRDVGVVATLHAAKSDAPPRTAPKAYASRSSRRRVNRSFLTPARSCAECASVAMAGMWCAAHDGSAFADTARRRVLPARPGVSLVLHCIRMPAKNPRVNVVLERPIYDALGRLARRDGTTLSTKARDLLREALETYEDLGLAEMAEERLRTLEVSKLMSHAEVWKNPPGRKR